MSVVLLQLSRYGVITILTGFSTTLGMLKDFVAKSDIEKLEVQVV